MADTAAHLVDRVLPEVPVRQWVLSLPFTLRYRLPDDSRPVSDVLRVFVRAVFAATRRRTREHRSSGPARCGAVTLNVHLHTLALDGVYVAGGAGQLPLVNSWAHGVLEVCKLGSTVGLHPIAQPRRPAQNLGDA